MADEAAPLPPIAVSMGEPAGIGTEILLKAWAHFSKFPPGKAPRFYLIDDPVRVAKRARELGADVRVTTISSPDEANGQFAKALPVYPLSDDVIAPLAKVEYGKPSPATAEAVAASIRTAVLHIAKGRASSLVTLPIQKEALQSAGFEYPGHTEFLGALTEEVEVPEAHERGPVMMLTAGPFRVVPVTIHTPIRDVPGALTSELIVRTGHIVAQSLIRDYGIPNPKIAVAGLNPHAGEGGRLGQEEIEVITPAIKTLAEDGISVMGPIPGDTLFHEEARTNYHAALAMYHDQALIPIKTVAFYAAINVTLGLPIVRTSPDHGTALPLVGKGIARPDSLINAIFAAGRMAEARKTFDAETGARGR